MTSSGFLIRFIDVGLIVLFGFVMISEIENVSPVQLSAEAGTAMEPDVPVERTLFTVGIAPDGRFSIGDPVSGILLAGNIPDTDVLQALLFRLKLERVDSDGEMIVLINPHEDSFVQHTVDVMDVCDRLDIAKSLQTDFEFRPNEAPA